MTFETKQKVDDSCDNWHSKSYVYADGINQYCKLSFIQRSTKIDPLTLDILRTNCCVINFSLSTPAIHVSQITLLCNLSSSSSRSVPYHSSLLSKSCTTLHFSRLKYRIPTLFMQSYTCLNVSNYLSIQNMHVFCNQQLHIFLLYIRFLTIDCEAFHLHQSLGLRLQSSINDFIFLKLFLPGSKVLCSGPRHDSGRPGQTTPCGAAAAG